MVVRERENLRGIQSVRWDSRRQIHLHSTPDDAFLDFLFKAGGLQRLPPCQVHRILRGILPFIFRLGVLAPIGRGQVVCELSGGFLGVLGAVTCGRRKCNHGDEKYFSPPRCFMAAVWYFPLLPACFDRWRSRPLFGTCKSLAV